MVLMEVQALPEVLGNIGEVGIQLLGSGSGLDGNVDMGNMVTCIICVYHIMFMFSVFCIFQAPKFGSKCGGRFPHLMHGCSNFGVCQEQISLGMQERQIEEVRYVGMQPLLVMGKINLEVILEDINLEDIIGVMDLLRAKLTLWHKARVVVIHWLIIWNSGMVAWVSQGKRPYFGGVTWTLGCVCILVLEVLSLFILSLIAWICQWQNLGMVVRVSPIGVGKTLNFAELKLTLGCVGIVVQDVQVIFGLGLFDGIFWGKGLHFESVGFFIFEGEFYYDLGIISGISLDMGPDFGDAAMRFGSINIFRMDGRLSLTFGVLGQGESLVFWMGSSDHCQPGKYGNFRTEGCMVIAVGSPDKRERDFMVHEIQLVSHSFFPWEVEDHLGHGFCSHGVDGNGFRVTMTLVKDNNVFSPQEAEGMVDSSFNPQGVDENEFLTPMDHNGFYPWDVRGTSNIFRHVKGDILSTLLERCKKNMVRSSDIYAANVLTGSKIEFFWLNSTFIHHEISNFCNGAQKDKRICAHALWRGVEVSNEAISFQGLDGPESQMFVKLMLRYAYIGVAGKEQVYMK